MPFIPFEKLAERLGFGSKNYSPVRKFITAVFGESVLVKGGADITQDQLEVLVDARQEMVEHRLSYDQVKERFYIAPAEQSRGEQYQQNVRHEGSGNIAESSARMTYERVARPIAQGLVGMMPQMVTMALAQEIMENPDKLQAAFDAEGERMQSLLGLGGGQSSEDFFNKVVVPMILPPEEKQLPSAHTPLLIEAHDS